MEYRFKKIRESLELKQREIAEKTGISRGAYANLEAETANVKLKYLLVYCNTFNLSMDYVCNLKEENDTSSLKQIKTIDKQFMANRLNTLEKENKKQAKDIAKELGILKSTYSGYKNPKLKNLIQTLMLKKIALKYNYSMDWIIGRGKNKKIH